MNDNTFEERREREEDRRNAVNAADDTGLVRQAEIRVENDTVPVVEANEVNAAPFSEEHDG